MLAEQFTAAAVSARSYRQLEDISRLLWRAHAEGALSDMAAQAAAEAVEARRAVFRGPSPSTPNKPLHARRRPVSPDKAASIARRRRLAASGAVPSRLAAAFTLSELSALTVVAREVQRRGRCELHIDAIAAKAGTCRTVVQNALRLAAAAGLARVTERRRAGQRSLSNVVEIVSPDWRQWLRLGGVGSNNRTPRLQGYIHSPIGQGDLQASAKTAIVKPQEDFTCTSNTKTPPS